MQQSSVIHSTFVIERKFPAPPAKVFAAFANAEKKRRWFVDGSGNQVEEYRLDFRTGGSETARFRFKEGTPVAGLECVNSGQYLDIVPDERVVTGSTMTIGGRCISASLVTVELQEEGSGTNLVLTHQGAFFPGADGPAMREEGWRKLVDRLSGELGEGA